MHTYNLELYFPDIRENQNKDQNKTFKAFVKINEGENNLNFDFIADSSAPNIYNGQKGYYKYIGTDESVMIPESINGNVLKDYYKMFEENRVVNKVSSNSTKVTDMAFMFYKSEVTDLDLSSFDTSKAELGYMFSGSLATTGYARTQVDADRFNSSGDLPSGLTFILR